MRELIKFRGRSKTINIPQRICTKWDEFGIFLLEDDNAAIIDSIAREQRDRPEQINKDILKRWIQGEGQPVTWETLVEVLRNIELNELANDIASVKCTEPVTNLNVNDPNVTNPSAASTGVTNPSVTSPSVTVPLIGPPHQLSKSLLKYSKVMTLAVDSMHNQMT